LRRDQISLSNLINHPTKLNLSRKQQKTIEEEKFEYARSAYMNVRRAHIKTGIGYKTNNQPNTRVNLKGQ
jgi:hypothetical protein